ncbi:MAG: peptidase S41 [Winogradskyella sp.]|uniref:S41 family peptidase n=1 Tax=Winogradskyella sp. TaxID=1883156 RepID=UPI00183B3B6B|nr:S41 family peptidase [Winogradskyella sp.]MBT8245088.1 peptidase S41 [Winogradskyella sp.]NNK22863.1 peptidase S41 [Winogradskyella sp.]
MKRFLRLCFVAVAVSSCGSIATYNKAVTELHPIEDLHEDVDAVYKQLQRLHPRLYQFTSKETLDYKFDSLKTAINTPMTSRDFYKELAQVTKYVGQGHMSLSPPSKRFDRKERKANLKLKFDINNLKTEYLKGTLFISNAKGNDSLLKHVEILKVDGVSTNYLIHKFKKTIASDGYNTTFHKRVAGKRFFGYYNRDIGRFDSISLTLRNADSTFIKKYKRLPKVEKKKETDSTKLDSLKKLPSKKKLTKTEKKAKKAKFKKMRKDRQKYGYNYTTKTNNRLFKFIGKDSAVAYMKIRGFSRGKYKDFYKEVFKKIDSAGTKNLVIDLRDNFGGRLNEITNLYSYLTDKNFTLINKSEINRRLPRFKVAYSNTSALGTKIIYSLLSPGFLVNDILRTSKKDGQLYYKFKSAKETEPSPLNFKGDVYVLINGNSFSASSIISTQLKGSKRATIVGEETGGAYNGTVAGFYKNYELPNTKVRARIGLMHIDSKYKIEPDGFGVTPDIEIIPTYQDRLNGVDPELEWVLDDTEKKK